jgi:hypothetical protein
MDWIVDRYRAVRRVEDLAPSLVTPIEAAGVSAIETVDRRLKPILFEPCKQVVIRRHQTETVAYKKRLGDKVRNDLNAAEVVGVLAEDVLFAIRA